MNLDNLIMISALQHIIYCERQYALIHVENLWAENKFTVEGDILHEKVHREHIENRKNFREEYGMPIRSLKYGLTGKCDLVEMWKDSPKGKVVRVNAVEFKRGKEKENDCDRVQLCAQVLCLEEMFGIEIKISEFYYFGEHRRNTVEISQELRNETIEFTNKIREINNIGKTPKAEYSKRKCDNCSFIDICMPEYISKNVGEYVEKCVIC